MASTSMALHSDFADVSMPMGAPGSLCPGAISCKSFRSTCAAQGADHLTLHAEHPEAYMLHQTAHPAVSRRCPEAYMLHTGC